ncbi:DUF5131 family protein [Nevskia sp.]|uniref:DUF5131 family protein n=1 Tax=Nevskia sp. TaxID=1929292 RepID=UPI0025D513A5|nr:DUF5131 family protein [Nevskia sp.]
MSIATNISWCDSTLNFWGGCTKVSAACDHCYAERDAARFKFADWGPGKPRKQMAEATRAQADKWNRKQFFECSACGWRGDKPALTSAGEAQCWKCCAEPSTLKPARRRVFVNSWSDWLDNEVPIEWLVDLLDRIRRCPNIDFLLLTKRIGNWRGRLVSAASECLSGGVAARIELGRLINLWLAGNPPENVWIGSTVVDQPELERDAVKLFAVPARIRFFSVEPMLAAMSFRWMSAWPENKPTTAQHPSGRTNELDGLRRLDWVIGGGESGAQARPLDMLWIRKLVEQCKAAGVPIHVKQMGRTPFFGEEGAGWADDFFNGGNVHWRADYRLPDGSLGVCEFRDREGRDINEWPEDLRVREFPVGAPAVLL